MFGIDAVLEFGGTVIDKIWPDAGEAEKAKARLAETAMKGGFSQEVAALNAKAQTLMAEMKGNFLQRSWRPILMLTFTYIIAHNYVIAPLFEVPCSDTSGHVGPAEAGHRRLRGRPQRREDRAQSA